MGPVSKSAKKAKTPGPDAQKKSKILQKKAQSEGGRVTKVSISAKTGPNSAKGKTPKATKKAFESEKKKLSFDELHGDDKEMIEKTPRGVKGTKSKTPKSSGKAKDSLAATESLSMTPKGKGVTPKMTGKKAMSEGAKSKQVSAIGSEKGAASAGGKLKRSKGTKMEDLHPIQLPFGNDDDYDEDEDEDFDVDDEFDDDDSDSGSDDDSEISDSDDESDDDESDISDSDDSEVMINPSVGKNKAAKLSETQKSESVKKQTPKTKSSSDSVAGTASGKKMDKTKTDLKSTKTPKSALKGSDDSKETQKSPKSALKTPGTAKSTGKKVSIVVTSPASKEEEKAKKFVTTPHPSLTKRRRPEEDDKENTAVEASLKKVSSGKKQKGKGSSESESDETPLIKQLSFGDADEDEENGEVTGKGQTGKRKLKENGAEVSSKGDGPSEKKRKRDGIYYHCGNLPLDVNKTMIKLFFAEADVELASIFLKKQTVEKIDKVKKGKRMKKLKEKQQIDHCYAILECETPEDAKRLGELNGIEFTAMKGKWRTHELVIYPVSNLPWDTSDNLDGNCVHIQKFNFKTSDQDLLEFFKEHGITPQRVNIARRGNRQLSKGYGFAWFKSKGDMKKAIKLTGTNLHDFTLTITKAKPKQKAQQYGYKIGSNLDRQKLVSAAKQKKK